MVAYYNEMDPYAAQWLRNLIDAGHIAPGIVDERSIEDVKFAELAGFTQCHFFAGIGVWSYALRLAGWPDSRPVWTGSCPCQPFSTAGKGVGFADERHLWPAWFHLVSECRPSIIFGEQVASADAGPWLDLVQDDMEGLGYAVGAVPFPAAGVGAPHIRDRLYWVANANGSACKQGSAEVRRWLDGGSAQSWPGPGSSCGVDGLGDAKCEGLEGRVGLAGIPGESIATAERQATERAGIHVSERPSPTNGYWRAVDWLACRDGKWRPIEPGASPLVDGAPSRVGRLRAYGNAICAPQAAAFIEAFELVCDSVLTLR